MLIAKVINDAVDGAISGASNQCILGDSGLQRVVSVGVEIANCLPRLKCLSDSFPIRSVIRRHDEIHTYSLRVAQADAGDFDHEQAE